MNKLFSKLKMATFSERFHGLKVTSMHNTNPEPFSKNELESVIGSSFEEILEGVSLGFAPDEGTLQLRQSISKNLYENSTANDVMTFAGAQEALFCAFSALLNAGDTVLVITPVFEPLFQMPVNLGCKVETVELDSSNSWALDLNQVELKFKQGCKVFVINFPHNPTGSQLTKAEFTKLIDLCRKYKVWLISDEVFRGLEHDSDSQLPNASDVYERAISVGVISKAFAIPGIRVGWAVCRNQKLRTKMIQIKSYLSICNSQIDEAIASKVFESKENILRRNLSIILKNKEFLTSIDKLLNYEIEYIIPNVGCCLFAKVNTDSADLVNKIAHSKQLLFYPSDLFFYDQQSMRIGFGSAAFIENISKCQTK